MPLQRRLPLLISILLLCLMVLFSWISYQGVKNAAMRTSRERLLSLSSQFGNLFSQSMAGLTQSTRVVANNPVIRQFLTQPSETNHDSAFALLNRVRQDSASVLIDIRDTSYRLLLRSSKGDIHTRLNFDSLMRQKTDTSVGLIYAFGDSLYYPVSLAIYNNRKPIGYLVRWRLLTTTPQTVEQLTKLIGSKASLSLGNRDGSLWTDMIKPISFHPADTSHLNVPVEYWADGGKKMIAAINHVPGTPWLVSVEFSEHSILESANRFLKGIILGGFILLIAGIILAWVTSRNIIRPLNRLTEAASGIAGGRYIYAEGIERRDEIGKLARAFNHMIDEVRDARQGLENKIVETGEINEQLRSLTAHLQNIREEERIHIAREMHDELGQLLTAFKMDISWLQKKLDTHPESAIKDRLRDMNKLTEDAVLFVRKIASELRPSVLDDFGLIPALEWHSEEFSKRFGIEVSFRANVRDIKTSSVVATTLFRMYQECLTNVARHAQATKVNSHLAATPDKIILTITDDGKGFEPQASDQKKTLGLLGMKERATMAGGQITVQSAPGKGTSVVIVLPSTSA